MIHTLMTLDKVKCLQVNPITTRPTFKAFQPSEGPKCPKMPQNGLKMGSELAHFTRWCTPNGLG